MSIEDLKAGDSFHACIPFGEGYRGNNKPMKIHIVSIIKDATYKGSIHFSYKVYGRHKQYWHLFLCHYEYMKVYIELAQKYYSKQNDKTKD